jgi:predicted LPLAT superfamily acyltransferase
VFAETVVDKLLSWFVDIDATRFVIAHPERVDEIMSDARGQLIIGSHFGNLEYCRGFMHRYRDKVINILVHDKHSENYNTVMRQLNPDSRLNVFQVTDFDIPTMLKIKAKIDAGEWVFIAGDRSPLSGELRTVPATFLNRCAQLPVGPYLLAKGLGCPVKMMFSYCDYFAAGKPVYFDIVALADKVTLDRKQRSAQLQNYAQRYADALQQQCAKAPFQWFNFYDFWAQTKTAEHVR